MGIAIEADPISTTAIATIVPDIEAAATAITNTDVQHDVSYSSHNSNATLHVWCHYPTVNSSLLH